MKKLLLIVVAALALSASCAAQKWRKGYITFSNGDTLRGLLLTTRKASSQSIKAIDFRASMDQPPVEFKPFTIESYFVHNQLYRAVVIFKSIMPLRFKASPAILSNVVNQTEVEENKQLEKDGHYAAYKGVGSSQIIKSAPDHFTGSITLPPECNIFNPDTVFARVILQTSYLAGYEIAGDRDTYFVGAGVTAGGCLQALQLCYFQADIEGIICEVYQYRAQLWQFCKQTIEVGNLLESNIQDLINRADYSAKDIGRVLLTINTLKGGKIIYATKQTLRVGLLKLF